MFWIIKLGISFLNPIVYIYIFVAISLFPCSAMIRKASSGFDLPGPCGLGRIWLLGSVPRSAAGSGKTLSSGESSPRNEVGRI